MYVDKIINVTYYRHITALSCLEMENLVGKDS